MLGGGNYIILTNWPTEKHSEYNQNKETSIKVHSFPYVLVNRSVL